MAKPLILIVDDDPTIRVAMDRWFKVRGFDTDVAEDGVEAVEKCRNNYYDVVTMDLEMPRMNGIDAIRIIKQDVPNIPIIVLTGYARNADQLQNMGVERILTKPLRMMELEKEVRRIVAASEQ